MGEPIPPWLLREPWFPVDAPLRTTDIELRRGRQFLLDVVRQFRVTEAPRYARTPARPATATTAAVKATTKCNILLWDVTRALGCEIPHWVDPETRSKPAPVGKGNAELDANAVSAWLAVHGPSHGWKPVTGEPEAILLVEQGLPVVAAWINPNGIGHVAPCVPAFNGPGLCVTQAGTRNFENLGVRVGFGSASFKLYWHR